MSGDGDFGVEVLRGWLDNENGTGYLHPLFNLPDYLGNGVNVWINHQAVIAFLF